MEQQLFLINTTLYRGKRKTMTISSLLCCSVGLLDFTEYDQKKKNVANDSFKLCREPVF